MGFQASRPDNSFFNQMLLESTRQNNQDKRNAGAASLMGMLMGEDYNVLSQDMLNREEFMTDLTGRVKGSMKGKRLAGALDYVMQNPELMYDRYKDGYSDRLDDQLYSLMQDHEAVQYTPDYGQIFSEDEVLSEQELLNTLLGDHDLSANAVSRLGEMAKGGNLAGTSFGTQYRSVNDARNAARARNAELYNQVLGETGGKFSEAETRRLVGEKAKGYGDESGQFIQLMEGADYGNMAAGNRGAVNIGIEQKRQQDLLDQRKLTEMAWRESESFLRGGGLSNLSNAELFTGNPEMSIIDQILEKYPGYGALDKGLYSSLDPVLEGLLGHVNSERMTRARGIIKDAVDRGVSIEDFIKTSEYEMIRSIVDPQYSDPRGYLYDIYNQFGGLDKKSSGGNIIANKVLDILTGGNSNILVDPEAAIAQTVEDGSQPDWMTSTFGEPLIDPLGVALQNGGR